MAKNELKLDGKVIEINLEDSKEAEGDINVAKPRLSKSYFEQIQDQRLIQRRVLFLFAVISTVIILIGLAFAVGFQAYFRSRKQIELFQNFELQILSGAVFIQVIGIINIIAKAIWDESSFTKLLAEGLRNIEKEKHKED